MTIPIPAVSTFCQVTIDATLICRAVWPSLIWQVGFVVVGMLVWLWPVAAQEVDLSALPAAVERGVRFREDVLPILEGHCLRCHGEERPKGSFNLRRREAALAGGDQGNAILLGDSTNSP